MTETLQKAVGYIRVSTTEQADSGLGLTAQRRKVEAQAEISDLELVEVIEDAGYSAKNLKRPGMDRLLALVDKGEVDVVIIAKLDRLSRSDIGDEMPALSGGGDVTNRGALGSSGTAAPGRKHPRSGPSAQRRGWGSLSFQSPGAGPEPRGEVPNRFPCNSWLWSQSKW